MHGNMVLRHDPEATVLLSQGLMAGLDRIWPRKKGL